MKISEAIKEFLDIFDFLKYDYTEVRESNLDVLYEEAETLSKIGYEVVGNGVFHDTGLRCYKLRMRKARNITRKFYLNLLGWIFVCTSVFISFLVGYTICKITYGEYYKYSSNYWKQCYINKLNTCSGKDLRSETSNFKQNK